MGEHGLIAKRIGDAFNATQHFGDFQFPVKEGSRTPTARLIKMERISGARVGDKQFISGGGNLAAQRHGNLFRVT